MFLTSTRSHPSLTLSLQAPPTAPLLTGNISAQDYMAKLQADLDAK